MTTRTLRNAAIVSFVVAMAVLLLGGYYARQRMAPIPKEVVSADRVLSDRASIMAGQDVYQRYGLMDHGSVWGHGSLRGMDFSADSLHRIGGWVRDYLAAGDAAQASGAYERLDAAAQRAVDGAAIAEMRENRYDAATERLTLTPAQAYALEQLRGYWEQVMGKGDTHHGFLENTVRTPEERRALADFFFWTAWAAGTPRAAGGLTFTSNWPPDATVGNIAPASALVWSLGGLVALFLVLGLVIYIVHRYQFFYGETSGVAAARALMEAPVRPSQVSAAKYFVVAILLFMVQIMNGGLLAHYTVHPGTFYIEAIGKFFSYSWAKSWHLQLAVFWIAISWVGTAIYLAPLISGREPRAQRALVNILFAATFLVVVGSLTGEVLGIKGQLGDAWFWLGHQG
jgi:nitric oxide reductase subunit B